MGPQSNSGSLPSGTDNPAADSPSADDLLALIPDMELLEMSEDDAKATHAALGGGTAAAGRQAVAGPKLQEQAATRLRVQDAAPAISDDPYADLMPELEAFAETVPVARTIPPIRPAGAPAPTVTAFKPPAPARVLQPPGAVAPIPRPAPQPPPAARAPATRTAAAVNIRKLPNPENVAVPPVMDREFIARNRIVELYLAGSLPVRGATVFEKFCRENPQILDEIGLPERVHTGLRLLEASGKPEPWQEKPVRFWERPYVPLALAALVMMLGIGILVLNRQLAEQNRKVDALHKLVAEQPLDAATGTVTVGLQVTHAGPHAAIATPVGGAAAQLLNLKIDMTQSEYRAFRITIDRVDQGRVAVLNNLIKDSNGQLGFSVNSSALGAGVYQLTIEGLDWRGDPQQDSWAAFTIRH